MATQTIDMNQGQPEFTDDELDSLRVGEQAQAAEQQRLAGKFESAEELEKAYIELQRKLGEPKEQDEPEVQQEELRETEASEEVELTPVAQLMTDASAEFYETGELTSETIEKFSEMSSKELVETYLEMQKNQPTASGRDLTESEVNVIYQQAGGQDAYDNLMQWAQESLPEEFTKAYDSVVDRGEAPAIQIALAGLQQQYEAANGVEGNLYTGRGSVDKPDVFRSQSEVIQAMQDRRYDTDPAYRQDVFQKLERSNIQM